MKIYIQETNIKNRICNYHFGNLVKGEKTEIKIILIDEKNSKDFTIYFTRYVYSKPIKKCLTSIIMN